MPIRKWQNWDAQSPRDNIWECLDLAEREQRRTVQQRRNNDHFLHRRRENRLHTGAFRRHSASHD